MNGDHKMIQNVLTKIHRRHTKHVFLIFQIVARILANVDGY